MGGVVRAAQWLLVCHLLTISTTTAQICSLGAAVLLEAPWAPQVGWSASVDVSHWTGVACEPTYGLLSM